MGNFKYHWLCFQLKTFQLVCEFNVMIYILPSPQHSRRELEKSCNKIKGFLLKL